MTDERKGLSKASMRGLRSKERMERMRAAAPPGIRVVPASDAIRKLMKHPARGGFPAEGGVEWPNDRFTKRRIADGSVTVEQPQPEPQPEPPPRGHRQREQHSQEPKDAA
ncbi:hypothetical protein [Bradyrhizobium zhanjiangense]|uniref:Uncharacterized protein n=1 Tax=Bradyrhizobium zhanjiangense TaxID=1325107 RepID=A0ABY0DGA5_9BRAD|nr:hypothetical protein [Bradyrhizobium zhanjiangense]RXG91587.1 hypothetical protein EAS62_24215 [Bradyrhizobium zhanjiangense]